MPLPTSSWWARKPTRRRRRQVCIKPGRGRLRAAGILHRAVFLLDADDVERRIGKHLRDAQRVGSAIDARGVAGLQHLAFPHADGVAAEQQRFGGLGGGIDEDRAGCVENARQFGAQFLAQLVVEIGERLVEQHQVGALDQRAGHRGALLLAAGQLQRRALQIGLSFSSCAASCTRFSISALGLPCTRRGEAMFS